MARKETERELCSEAEVDLQTAQPISYEKVETWLMSYSEWKLRVEYLQSELSNIPKLTRTLHLVAARNCTPKQDSVLKTVIRRMEITEYEIPLLLSRN